jgi:hypothetical protein
MSNFLVPVVDVRSLECETIAVAAPSVAAAVWEVLRNAAHLRYTGGTIERVELIEENSVNRDVWHERYRAAKSKEGARWIGQR